jgi:peptidoglycan/LPS O-acetylase OafA/YrhL
MEPFRPLPEGRSLANIEGLRLIASVLIVANHYFQYLHFPTHGLQLAVDLFFVISGIVIAMMYQERILCFASYSRFVRKRIARLYPLHLATLLFYVAVGYLITAGYATPESVEKYNSSQIVPNLLMIHAWSPFGVISYNYVSWSISAEFFVYLCFPLVLLAITRSFRGGILVCVTMLLVAMAISQWAIGTPLPELNWRLGALRAIPSFSFGVWLWANRDRLSRITILRNFAGLATLIGTLCLLGLIAFNASDYPMLACIYAIVVGAFISDVTGGSTFASWSPISSRGYLTYSIYMIHTVVATIVISFIFPKLAGRSLAAVLAAVICSAALTYGAAYLSYWYFETPLRLLIGGKKQAPRTVS